MMGSNIHVLSRSAIISENHILLAYDPRPIPNHYYALNSHFYYLPGGHIEFQESAEQALVREIKEEMGFDSAIERFLGVMENAWDFPGDAVCCHIHEINLIFKVTIPDLEYGNSVAQKEDHVAFQWVSMDHLKTIDFRPLQIRNSLPHWLQCADNGVFQSSILQ
jgi:8-oxo-dGTP pyrophosphatase MutT (NUDIX family)